MGPASIRRDILSQFREEKLKLGITGRSRRGRRGRRAPKDASANHGPTALPAYSRGFPHTCNGGDDKENAYIKHEDHEIDDDEEFFDAEDAYFDDIA